MLKFHVVFVAFCLFQISNGARGTCSVKQIERLKFLDVPKKEETRKIGPFNVRKQIERVKIFDVPTIGETEKIGPFNVQSGEWPYVKQNERVKIINGPRIGQTGEIGPFNVQSGQWPVYLPYEDEFGNKFKKEVVYLNPKNLMIMDRRGYSRLTPYESDVQLWENDDTSDLIMDIPRIIKDKQLDEIKNLLEKRKWKELLKYMLKYMWYRSQFYEIIVTALTSRMRDDVMVRAIDDVYEEDMKDGRKHFYLHLSSYYNLLKTSAKQRNLAVTQKLINIDQKRFHESLWEAVNKRDAEMCEFLVQNGANVNSRGCCESTPLMKSIQLKNIGCFRAIMKSENVDVNLYQMHYKTALQFAARLGTGEMCEALMKKGANVDYMGEESAAETPLMIAARHGNLDCMRVLLKHNANDGLLNRDNENALAIAERYDQQECVNCLVMYWKKEFLKVVQKVGHRRSKACPLKAIKI